MIGLSKITDKILAEAREDARLAAEAAEGRAREIMAESALRAETLKKEIDLDARRQAEELVSRAHADEEMIKRSAALEARSAMVDEVFVAAKKEILNLPTEKYLDLLFGLFMKAYRTEAEETARNRKLYGEEDAPEESGCEILLSKRDRDRVGDGLMARVESAFKDKGIGEIPTLSRETAPIDGGLVLRFGNIEVNCSLKALFGMLRSEYEGRVVARLFPEKRS